MRARCFAMVERLLSKREKLVNALMRTFVAADPQLVSVSRWAAAQVEVALASYTHMASLDEGQRIKWVAWAGRCGGFCAAGGCRGYRGMRLRVQVVLYCGSAVEYSGGIRWRHPCMLVKPVAGWAL